MVDPVEVFLSTYPDDVQQIARELRSMARHEMRSAYESLYYDGINYSLTSSPSDRVCSIKPSRRGVSLAFPFGRNLIDPHHLLRRPGLRARHVAVNSLENARDPALKDLVRMAWDSGPQAIDEMRLETKQRLKQRTSLRKRRKTLRRTDSQTRRTRKRKN